MTISRGSTDISGISIGTTEAVAVSLGATEVWSSGGSTNETLLAWQFNQGADGVQDDISTHARALPSFVHADMVSQRLVAGSSVRHNPGGNQTAFAWTGAPTKSIGLAPNNNDGGDSSTIDFSTYQSYVDIPVQADVGLTLSLAQLSFGWAKGGSSGTRGFGVRSSHDSYASWLLLVNDIPTTRTTDTLYSADLSGIPSANSVTLRLYFWTPAVYSNIEAYGDTDGPGWVITGQVA